jgi:transcriptional regulator with XRE-family HTH domain
MTRARVQDHRLATLRRAAGLSLEELAERANTNKQTLYSVESGKARLSLPWMRRLARALQVKPDELLLEQDRSIVLSPEERAILDEFRDLPAERRALVAGILRGMKDPEAA